AATSSRPSAGAKADREKERPRPARERKITGDTSSDFSRRSPSLQRPQGSSDAKFDLADEIVTPERPAVQLVLTKLDCRIARRCFVKKFSSVGHAMEKRCYPNQRIVAFFEIRPHTTPG